MILSSFISEIITEYSTNYMRLKMLIKQHYIYTKHTQRSTIMEVTNRNIEKVVSCIIYVEVR